MTKKRMNRTKRSRSKRSRVKRSRRRSKMKIGGLFGRTDNSIQVGDKIKVKERRHILNLDGSQSTAPGAAIYNVIETRKEGGFLKLGKRDKYLIIQRSDTSPTFKILESNAVKQEPAPAPATQPDVSGYLGAKRDWS